MSFDEYRFLIFSKVQCIHLFITVSAFCALFKQSFPTSNLASLNSGSSEAIKSCVFDRFGKMGTIKLFFRHREGKVLRGQKGRGTVVPKWVETYGIPLAVHGGKAVIKDL